MFCFSCGLPFDEATTGRMQFDPSRTESGFKPVGFWARLLAMVIDLVVLGIVDALLGFLLFDGPQSNGSSLLTLLLFAGYYTLGVSMFSTTLGKRAINAYVLRPDGSKVSALRAFGRWLAYIPSALLLFVGFLIVAFREDKQGLHDRLSDTVVVYR